MMMRAVILERKQQPSKHQGLCSGYHQYNRIWLENTTAVRMASSEDCLKKENNITQITPGLQLVANCLCQYTLTCSQNFQQLTTKNLWIDNILTSKLTNWKIELQTSSGSIVVVGVKETNLNI